MLGVFLFTNMGVGVGQTWTTLFPPAKCIVLFIRQPLVSVSLTFTTLLKYLQSGSLTDGNFSNMSMPLMSPEVQINASWQQYQQQWHLNAHHQPIWGREEESHHFVTPENSPMTQQIQVDKKLFSVGN